MRADEIAFLQSAIVMTAIKEVLARQLSREMNLKKITKTEMATKMQTSRAQLDRLLNPKKTFKPEVYYTSHGY